MSQQQRETGRKIIHIDMDAFYAAVEERDFPNLAGKPVIVGGSPVRRGVVATCNYVARRFGIHSAMSSARAVSLCPDAIIIKPRFSVYREVSEQIFNIFRFYTDLVEPLSLDEAYLDVTEATMRRTSSATELAAIIKQRIKKETRLTASAGISYNKFLAKIASDMQKPDGLFTITPAQGEAFIAKLPVGKFHGVGKVTEARMKQLGIETGADLERWSMFALSHEFGKVGSYYYNIARGIDERLVVASRVRKSISVETTFVKDLTKSEDIVNEMQQRAKEVALLLVEKEMTGRTVVLKIKFFDFQLITRSRTMDKPVKGLRELNMILVDLLAKSGAYNKPVRLIGVGLSNLCGSKMARMPYQMDLFI